MNLCKDCKWCSVNYTTSKLLVPQSSCDKNLYGFWSCHHHDTEPFCNYVNGDKPTCIQMRGMYIDAELPYQITRYEDTGFIICGVDGRWFEGVEK